MKIAPLMDAVKLFNLSASGQKHPMGSILVHTGQHYDEKMSRLFFDDLGIPKPDINLGVGSSSHAVQTAEIMKRFEPILQEHRPDLVVVVGDVNSTIACSLVASKTEYPDGRAPRSQFNAKRPMVAHVEAGLRSFDRTMPEEINRILTDSISDLLFTTEKGANENLCREGISEDKIHFVGNVMIDTLLKHRDKAEQSEILYKLGLINSHPANPTDPCNPTIPYAVLTLHRPSNVDNIETFGGILEALTQIAEDLPIIFPVHPRTLNQIRSFKLEEHFINLTKDPSRRINPHGGIHAVEPLGYIDFLQLMSHARLVLTDSGGIQEETTILGVPCVTLRENTERPVTVTHGTNVIAGTDKNEIVKHARRQFDKYAAGSQPLFNPGKPELWDGQAAERIVEVIKRLAKESISK